LILLKAPKHPPSKRTFAAQELYFLSGLSGAVPEAGQLAALLLFDQLQGRREGDTTLSKCESRQNFMAVSYAIAVLLPIPNSNIFVTTA
jgi:hypothetical protein